MMPEEEINNTAKKGAGGVIIFLIILAIGLVGLFVVGLLPRIERQGELKKAHQETVDAIPLVHTVQAHPARHSESILLPGNIGAIQYTTIYARVDGYLTERLVDIGDQVKKGELIAEIDTPTINDELDQAKADLLKAKAGEETSIANCKEAQAKQATADSAVVKAKANLAYATVTAKRWQDMCERGTVSQQSRDEKIRLLDTTNAELAEQNANLKAAIAAVEAAKAEIKQAKANVLAKAADVARLTAEQSFQKVLAPFDGIITLRKVDPGALITKGSQSSNLELYQMAKIDALRIYVSVPQRVARYLHNGMSADVQVPEYPERKFTGIVTNVSGALDPNTRTRQTEIKIENKDHALLPGMYAEVKLGSLREEPWIRVPGTTIVTKTNGLFVVVVKDGKAHYQPITMGRDFGDEVEVRIGLRGGETVVVSPSDDLREGEAINTQPLPNNEAT
ncbi:MAG: efflux RND transporter periplasmic adaptor subunit [Candidatus Obscuribacterales bacterium]|nr:efflux RND transporter periplasmic adaptor subunit [Candidatus Obscuribacterales bacterium]